MGSGPGDGGRGKGWKGSKVKRIQMFIYAYQIPTIKVVVMLLKHALIKTVSKKQNETKTQRPQVQVIFNQVFRPKMGTFCTLEWVRVCQGAPLTCHPGLPRRHSHMADSHPDRCSSPSAVADTGHSAVLSPDAYSSKNRCQNHKDSHQESFPEDCTHKIYNQGDLRHLGHKSLLCKHHNVLLPHVTYTDTDQQ